MGNFEVFVINHTACGVWPEWNSYSWCNTILESGPVKTISRDGEIGGKFSYSEKVHRVRCCDPHFLILWTIFCIVEQFTKNNERGLCQETDRPHVAPMMDPGLGNREEEGEAGRGGARAVGTNFAHHRSEETGSKRGERRRSGGGDDFVPRNEGR